MTCQAFRYADLIPLTGGIRAFVGLSSEIKSTGEAFTALALAADIPAPLRRYYAKLAKKLTDVGGGLDRTLKLAKHEGQDLMIRINSSLDSLELTEKELARLRHVNNQLLELEKTLEQKIDGMRERLEGLNPTGVEWDEWDGFDLVLWARIGSDPERPAYGPDVWEETGIMAPLEIRVEIWEPWASCHAADDTNPRGLNDGQNHSELSGCEGDSLQHFHQCNLFHEIESHARVGLWGMLHLQSLWIEIIPHRSGTFVI